MEKAGLLLLIIPVLLIVRIIERNLALGRIKLAPARQKTGTRRLWQWAGSSGFERAGSYTCSFLTRRIFVSAWRHESRPIFLYAVLEKGIILKCRSVEIVSIYENEYTLVTGSRNTRTQAGPPHCYKQFFPRLPLEQRWQKHLDADRYLQKLGLLERRGAVDVQTCFEQYVSKEARHRRKNPLFPLAAICGYLIGRHSWTNVPVRTQIERKRVKRPCEVMMPVYQ